MLKNKRIAIIVPAYNEELLIGRVLETLPSYVDKVYVVDDASIDQTASKVSEFISDRTRQMPTELIQNSENYGVGAAIVIGYKKAIEDGSDVVAVMAGDAQMDPEDLESILMPILENEADYAKGNRLFTGEAWDMIPRHRYLGNAVLSLLTKICSGYWHVADSQTGFTAISKKAIEVLPLDKLYPRYGYPNHMLTMCNVYSLRVKDVPIKPVYNVGEKSGIRLLRDIPRISWLLIKNFFWRLSEKYIIRDFHPLVFFYGLAFLLLTGSLPLLARIVWIVATTGSAPPVNTLAFMFTVITGLQSLFFAMWFDMDYNKRLK